MPLRVAIIGGGIGGLSLAVSLSRLQLLDAVQVDLYESAQALTEIGAGISFWPRSWDILKRLGIESAMLEAGITPPPKVGNGDAEQRPAVSFRKSDKEPGFDIFQLKLDESSTSAHRAKFLSVLVNNTDPRVAVHLGHRLTGYTRLSDGALQLSFNNGSTAICDFLVGADGMKSVVRKQFVSELPPNVQGEGDVVWSGMFAYRALVSSEEVMRRLPNHRALDSVIAYCGKSKHISVYPLPGKEKINVVAFSTDKPEGTPHSGPAFVEMDPTEVRSQYAGWEQEVQVLLENITHVTRWAIQDLNLPALFARGNIALLGDAAHAMAPHHGTGAGHAIEDAYTLALLLKRSLQKQLPIDRVTEAFDEVRRPFISKVHAAVRRNAKLYEFLVPEYADVTDNQMAVENPSYYFRHFGAKVANDWEYAWTRLTDEDWEESISRLDEIHS